MSWSAVQYTKFEEERTRPVHDLLARVRTPEVATAVDIGCGPGNSTEVLKMRFAGARISGMDSSSDMIEAARKRLPGMLFYVEEIAGWADAGPFDVILANAVLQWLPGHEVLLPKLLDKLAPGGSLAVQMPVNLDEPAHQLMRKVAVEGPWANKLTGANTARVERHEAAWYYQVLREAGASVDIWRTTYYHTLSGIDALVEWFKGTGLRPFLDPLEAAEREAFLARYKAELAGAYPLQADGTVLLPFPRLFFVATR